MMRKDQKTDKLLQAFGRYLEKNDKHDNTVRSYLNDCRQFLQWIADTLGPDAPLSEVTRSDVHDYRGFLLTRKTSAASVNRKLTALRQFFEYCIGESIIQQNPVALIPGITARVAAPQFLTRKEASALLRVAEQSIRPVDAVVIVLLLQCGMRSGELCALTIGDLHLSPRDARLFIKGQHGRKMRFVYLPTRARVALRNYCSAAGIRINDRRRRTEPLLLVASGVPMTQQAVDHIVKRVGKTAGMEYVKATLLRNSYVVHSLQRGMSADAVARSMGTLSVKAFIPLAGNGAGNSSAM
jgi:site-specific recombinase XerD